MRRASGDDRRMRLHRAAQRVAMRRRLLPVEFGDAVVVRELRAHGLYYFVNGLLVHFDTEGVLALIAPRPLLALTGDLDAGSPADGIKDLELILSRTYASVGAGDRFRSILYPDLGHTYTPEMRAEMLAWFNRWLQPGRSGE